MWYKEERDYMYNKQEMLDAIIPVVKPTLKAPLTAVFCSAEELSILAQPDGKVKVVGYVNSQNSYGAMIRTNFTYTLMKNAEGQWVNAGGGLENQAAKNYGSSLIMGIVTTVLLYLLFYYVTNPIIFNF